MNPFFWVVRLTNFHQPGHKLTGGHTKHDVGIATHMPTYRQHNKNTSKKKLWEIMDNECDRWGELGIYHVKGKQKTRDETDFITHYKQHLL